MNQIIDLPQQRAASEQSIEAAMGWQLPSMERIEHAAEIVARTMPPTPQYNWPLLSARAGVEVWVKHENHTPVGAFKIRGALVYMELLARERPEVRGVLCATRGNFGQAISFAARRHGLTATIIVPFGNSPDQNRAIKAQGAELIEHGEDFQSANEFAAQLERERGDHRIPSFHELLVHGTATYGLEFLRGSPELDSVYVPIGLGSSICGMIAAREALGLRTKIIGVVSAHAPAYALSFAARQSIDHEVTSKIADGLACRKPVPESLDFIFKGVERIVQVTDDEIAAAMVAIYDDTHQIAEGAGAASTAAMLQDRKTDAHDGGPVGVVLSGCNMNRETFASILRRGA